MSEVQGFDAGYLTLPSSLTSEGKDFISYWDSLREGRYFPDRKDIEPGAIKRLLPYIVIHDLVSPNLIRLRLIGTAVAEDYEKDITGWNYLDMVEPARREAASRALFILHDTPAGMSVTLRSTTRSGNSWTRQTIDLPISDLRSNRKLIISCSLRAKSGMSAVPGNPELRVQQITSREFFDIGAGIPYHPE
ncbi:PAS domain-containing protein [Nisaea nitritireducens]|uniref:PAS domain-containing protein n=1 Tax=Nisaea nitritireducens TaxID=568392 RepID=UPI0018690B5F|nr:PAS domain-containing protein [Nisaea nitritireducens]